MIRIAILDDYQNVSLTLADWSPLAGRAGIAPPLDLHVVRRQRVVGRSFCERGFGILHAADRAGMIGANACR